MTFNSSSANEMKNIIRRRSSLLRLNSIFRYSASLFHLFFFVVVQSGDGTSTQQVSHRSKLHVNAHSHALYFFFNVHPFAALIPRQKEIWGVSCARKRVHEILAHITHENSAQTDLASHFVCVCLFMCVCASVSVAFLESFCKASPSEIWDKRVARVRLEKLNLGNSHSVFVCCLGCVPLNASKLTRLHNEGLLERAVLDGNQKAY